LHWFIVPEFITFVGMLVAVVVMAFVGIKVIWVYFKKIKNGYHLIFFIIKKKNRAYFFFSLS